MMLPFDRIKHLGIETKNVRRIGKNKRGRNYGELRRKGEINTFQIFFVSTDGNWLCGDKYSNLTESNCLYRFGTKKSNSPIVQTLFFLLYEIFLIWVKTLLPECCCLLQQLCVREIRHSLSRCHFLGNQVDRNYFLGDRCWHLIDVVILLLL